MINDIKCLNGNSFATSNRIEKEGYCFCERCNNPVFVKFSIEVDGDLYPSSINDSGTKMLCRNCGDFEWHYPVDYKLKDLISLCNRYGFITTHSCQGHILILDNFPMVKDKNGKEHYPYSIVYPYINIEYTYALEKYKKFISPLLEKSIRRDPSVDSVVWGLYLKDKPTQEEIDSVDFSDMNSYVDFGAKWSVIFGDAIKAMEDYIKLIIEKEELEEENNAI